MITDMSDSDLLLTLCIYEEGLPNPTDIAARLRAAILAYPTAPEEMKLQR